MVTSNVFPDKIVVKMAKQNNSIVIPHRILLGEVNEHITCPLCHGYYIDATIIVECLHSFCRSCIIKHLQAKSYCPECEMMVNSAKPNLKADKKLQDIVYKLVPGLFQREMVRRQQFYLSRPASASTATREQRGEDTERIIFSPEDVISFSLEYADATDTDSISSRSSESNEQQTPSAATRRFLQCPAMVKTSQLKKFISMKFDIDSTQYSIDILYKKVPLPDYYSLMDIAYIYNWKRNEPMRLLYQITDYTSIRTRYRFFDMNIKGSHFHDNKSSSMLTEETNVDTAALNPSEQCSESPSEASSPTPEENINKKTIDIAEQPEKQVPFLNDIGGQKGTISSFESLTTSKKCDDEVEKSQFLNSFELTAKSRSGATKPPCSKLNNANESISTAQNLPNDSVPKVKAKEILRTILEKKHKIKTSKDNDTLKRKLHTPPTLPEMKKLKIELEKINIPTISSKNIMQSGSLSLPHTGIIDGSEKKKKLPKLKLSKTVIANSIILTPATFNLPVKDIQQTYTVHEQQLPKQQMTENVSIKRTKEKHKTNDPLLASSKTASPLKLKSAKVVSPSYSAKSVELLKPTFKNMPDLTPSGEPPFCGFENKGQNIGKLRMDLLANNSDPTIDRSKILSQVKSSLENRNSVQMTSGEMSEDPLKSLFDSCKIYVPSSLSITLTDLKHQKNPKYSIPVDQKKKKANKNISLTSGNTSGAHKLPNPPVHNYIEILKLPDTDLKKHLKPEIHPKKKPTINESVTDQSKPSNNTSETSTKGPIPSLKPIAHIMLENQNVSGPVTFQQTFEQQILSIIQSDENELPKSKLQMPNLMPVIPKVRIDNIIHLPTPHSIHSQLYPEQTKKTMQSIAGLAKRQYIPTKLVPIGLRQNNMFSAISSRPKSTKSIPLKLSQSTSTHCYKILSHKSRNTAQTSPRSPTPTRSPSSSPKLVIAEETHTSSTSVQNIHHSSQITSTQISNYYAPNSESPKSSTGPSKQIIKPGKVCGIRQPMMTPNPDLQMQQTFLQQHVKIQNAWVQAQRLNMSHQNINMDNQHEYVKQ